MEGGFFCVLLGQALLQKILLLLSVFSVFVCSCVVFIPLSVCVCCVLRSLSSVPRMALCLSLRVPPVVLLLFSVLFVCLFVHLFTKKVPMTI